MGGDARHPERPIAQAKPAISCAVALATKSACMIRSLGGWATHSLSPCMHSSPCNVVLGWEELRPELDDGNPVLEFLLKD